MTSKTDAAAGSITDMFAEPRDGFGTEPNFQVLTMADVMSEFHDGPHATPPESETGPIYLGIKNLTPHGLLDLSQVRRISEEDWGQWTKRVTPQPGDIVFSYEATLHRYAIIPKGFRGCLGRRLALIRPDPTVVSTDFLMYSLLSPQWRATIESNINIGSTVDRIPLTEFPSFPISLPALSVQKNIGRALKSFDDLIENNQRRIELLEETALLLYREWFVNFRYPSHEDVPLLDSDLGPIPDGWLATTLDQIGHVTIGGDWGEDTSPGKGWVEVGCLRGVDLERLRRGDPSSVCRRWIKEGSLEKRQLVEGDLVVEGSGECGRALAYRDEMQTLVGTPLIYSNFCKRLRLADLPSAIFCEFLFNEMCRDGRMGAFKTGTAIPNLNFKALTSQALFVVPDPSSIESLNSQVSPLQAFGLTGINRNLSEARDLLIPRLVSGDLDISDLDLDLEAAS
jgi:type I restriction enzyme, S subunit